MDPVLLATVTSSLSFLATEVTKGIATESGKGLWNKVCKQLFPRQDIQPNSANITVHIAQALVKSPELLTEIANDLKNNNAGHSSSIIQYADKIININTPNISGDLKIEM